jgi:hypothetical protein
VLPRGRVLVRVIIVATVIAATAVAAHNSLDTTSALTSPASTAYWTAEYDQVQCLQASVRRLVHRDDLVFVGNGSANDQVILATITAPWARATLSTHPVPQWNLSLEKEADGCAGLQVVALKWH